MTERALTAIPGYDVLSKRRTPSWNEQDARRSSIGAWLSSRRAALLHRATSGRPLDAICARIMPQPHDRAARFRSRRWSTPRCMQRQIGRISPRRHAARKAKPGGAGLRALDAEAQRAHGAPFHDLPE